MLNKKIKKLVRDPKLFFHDMFKKNKIKLQQVVPQTVNGHYQYSVVSAVYNVGRYLDDYFKGFTSQKLNFKNHIQLILVDDGSTDNSSEIIIKWQKKYPNNIKYIWKENGGQSSARNLGMQHANADWVTFIDPDDFVDQNYFSSIDDFLYKNKKNDYYILSTKIVFYIENNRAFKDTHPLNYKFLKGNASCSIDNIGKNIQLSAATAFFRNTQLKLSGLMFDPAVKPNFEDGKFIAEYLLSVERGMAAFLSEAKYYYRKREDGTSTLDTAWEKPERFTHVPKFGYLSILKKYKDEKGYVPVNIQRTFLYEIVWNLKWLLNKPEKVHFLTDEEREGYLSTLMESFEYIDVTTILNFELAGCWFYYKVGMLSLFKNICPESQIVYIEDYDRNKKMVQLRYFSRCVSNEVIYVDGVDTFPGYVKTISHDFLGEKFLIERRIWISVDEAKTINVNLDAKSTRLSLASKQYPQNVNVSDIAKHFENIIPKYNKNPIYVGSWLLMDRDTQADDNAEHLYRYIRKNHCEKKIYFVLRKNSHDWGRLKNDGFNLIEFGTTEHEDAMRSCSKVISSHADKYVTNYLGPRMLHGRHFVFLQHGVTKDDLSGWLNRKEHIDCFITATTDEYNSIVNNESRYYYGEKEVKLTGFPRHDRLVELKEKSEKLIIVMPTWRLSIVGDVIDGGNERAINPDFMSTKFASHWHSFLHSSSLKNLAKEFGYKIAFFPHANIQPYLHLFNIPEYIEIIRHHEGSIQNLFSKASLMITDYSSVAFEMAVQDKQTIYYQFDEDECFTGAHIYSKGYFDYRTHGFGPVVTKEDDLIHALELALKNGSVPDHEVLDRIRNTFPLRDGKCCERVFNAIKDLDDKYEYSLNLEIVHKYACQATLAKKWEVAEQRWNNYITAVHEVNIKDYLYYIESLRYVGKLDQALLLISSLICHEIESVRNELLNARALIYMSLHRWDDAILDWEMSGNAIPENKMYCLSLAYSGKAGKLTNMLSMDLDNNVIPACILFANSEWRNLISYLEHFRETSSGEFWPFLLLLKSYAYRTLEMANMAHECLVEFEKTSTGEIQCRFEIVRLAHANGNASKVIGQLDHASHKIEILPFEFIYYYLHALRVSNSNDKSHSLYGKIDRSGLEKRPDLRYYLDICVLEKDWTEIITILSSSDYPLFDFDKDIYLSVAYKNTGNYVQAYKTLCESTYKYNLEKWLLRSELAQINDEWDDAYSSWRQYVLLTGSVPFTEHLEQLQKLKMLSELTQLRDSVN